MNIKNNKRHQGTIQKIQDILLDNLRTKDLAQIKVSDICKQARINRSTFYANFADIYDLANRIKLQLEEEVNHLLSEVLGGQYSDADFLKLFQHIKENQTLYLLYFKLGYDRRDTLIKYDIYQFNQNMDPEYLDYHITFFKNGFNAIVMRWLHRGCEESPEQMRDILLYEYKNRY